MPTNFSGSLNPLVVLKSGAECSLKRHFTGCARQVIGYLDKLAANDEDRLVWISVEQIRRHCKNYDKPDSKGIPTTYGKSMVNKALKCFRDEGILSKRAAVALQERRGYRVAEAFVVTPHTALTHQQGKSCRWIGMGQVPGTTWAAAPGRKVWFRAKSRTGEFPATIEFTVGSGSAITSPITPQSGPAITPTITLPITPTTDTNAPQKESAGYTAQPVELIGTKVDSSVSQKVLPKFANGDAIPNPLNLRTPKTTQPTQPLTQGRGVCVLTENLSAMEADKEIDALQAEFVKQNDGEPGPCSANQKRQLKELAMQHGRDTFRAAARAWFANRTWNSKTTDPFIKFISGFAGYAAVKAVKQSQADRIAQQKKDAELSAIFSGRKFAVNYGQLDPEYLASLRQVDRDYITQVAVAQVLNDLPPDNGRGYYVEEIAFRKKRRDEEPGPEAF